MQFAQIRKRGVSSVHLSKTGVFIMKKARLVLILSLCLAFSSCSFMFKEAKAKTFAKAGLSITLTDEFNEKDQRSYTACYDSAHVAVFVLKEEFTLLQGLEDASLDDYCALVIENNNKDSAIQKEGGLTYFVFEFSANGKEYTYFCPVFKGSDAFWLVQFSCVTSEYNDYLEKFIAWANTVEV